ncbi:hypothetical protein C8R42DRAFT_703081 [Lentinula raphanica]|nr:hypothetical protein C8R42DRAFT_703081 [Lentinula raphanica]
MELANSIRQYTAIIEHRANIIPAVHKKLFISNAKLQTKAESSRKRLDLTKLPSILSLPGRYCSGWNHSEGNSQRRRIRLYDRQAVVQHLASDGLPKFDKVARELKRYMAIISAPISRHFASFGPVVESSVPGRFMHATKD